MIDTAKIQCACFACCVGFVGFVALLCYCGGN